MEAEPHHDNPKLLEVGAIVIVIVVVVVLEHTTITFGVVAVTVI